MFDPSAPHIIILLVVVLLLFGSRRLPGAAKSLGESMHIFKKSVHGLDEKGQPLDQAGAASQPALPVAAAQPASASDPGTQQLLADLQRQVQDLRGSEAPHSQQTS
ncbi:MAG: twin-arginine translocase TatA/TatE family subunit [Streptosporangiaceae bacterium]